MPEVVKCPACADQTSQEWIRSVRTDDPLPGGPIPSLYRCHRCGFLYTVPKLEDHEMEP
ncbi:MAG TPA: hypothetical protein VHC22_24920 [Pirellulales bacterium]|nr:hypothetical protein [Pirellulales bacterium]